MPVSKTALSVLSMLRGKFCVKNNRPRRLFAWRHLEAGQYVTQSGLHVHQSEPHIVEIYNKPDMNYADL
jgi:hypothetical protein